MATSVKLGKNTLLKRGATTVAEVKSLSGPGTEKDTPEATHMESPDDAREFINGLIDAGEFSAELNFLPGNATHKQLLTDLWSTGAAITYSITWPAGEVWSFSCHVKSFEPDTDFETPMSANVGFKLTGKPTYPA